MTDRASPAGWAWTTLGNLGRWYGGGTPSKRRHEFWDSGTIPWLSPKDMGVSLLVDTQDHITEAAVAGSATSLVPANSVALVVRSGILERKAPVALVPFSTTMNQDMKAIAPHASVDPKWLLYVIQSQEQALLHGCRKAGTTVASLDTAKVHGLPIPLPPLPEQHRIVEVLEDHLSRLDAGIANLASAKLRAKMLHRKRPDPAATEFGFPRRVLKSLLREPLRNGHSGRVTQSGSGIRAVTLSAVTRNEFSERYTKLTDTSKSKAESLWLEDGDIFVQRSNAPELVGTSALYRGPNDWAIFPDLLIRVRSDEDEVLPEYLAEVLRSDSVKAYFRRSARGLSGSMPKISQGTIEEVVVPLPTIARQQQWVSDAQESLTTDARLRDSIDTVGERSVALRRSLLRAAFNGELVDQDPTDEPADVALARIRDQQSSTPNRRGRRTAAAQ